MISLAVMIMGLMGVVALAVAGESLHKGRIWFRPKYHPEQGHWLRRSREPFGFWAQTGGIGLLGICCFAFSLFMGVKMLLNRH